MIPGVLLCVALLLIETVTIYREGMKALTGRDIVNILVAIPFALLMPFGVRTQTLEFSPTGLLVSSRLPWSQPEFYHWGKLENFYIVRYRNFRHGIHFFDKSEYVGIFHSVGVYLTKSQAQDLLALIQNYQGTFAIKENGAPTT